MMRYLPVALASTLLLAACGSTVQVRSQALQSDGLQAGSGFTATTPESSTTGGAALAPGAVSGTTGGSVTGSSGTTGVPTLTSAAPVPTTAAKLSPVELGIVLFPDVNEAAAALGGSADVGNQKAEAQDAVNWVNGHGGLAGHKVVPVWFSVSLTSTQPYSVTYEQICTSFTQDHHVVAVVFIGNAEAGFPSCLAKTRTLFLAHGHYLHSAEDYRSLWNLVTPEDAGSDRIARALVKEILDRKLLKSGETLGLLVMNYAAPQKAKDAIIVPAMKAAGIKVLSYTIPYPQSTQDIANSASSVQSAELAMAAQGVKNVTFMCPGCFTFFMQYAESQAYYPRYLISSLETLLNNFKGKGHGQSLASAVAVGWDPVRDVSTYANPGLMAGNPTYKLCRTVEKANISNDASLFASLAFCSALLQLQAAANANPVAALTGPSLLTGFNALGTSHAGAANFSTVLGSDRHDGTASYRTLHYDAPCDCMLYDNATSHAFP